MVIMGDKGYYEIQLAYAKIKEEAENARLQQSSPYLECFDRSQKLPQDQRTDGDVVKLRLKGPEGLSAMGLRP